MKAAAEAAAANSAATSAEEAAVADERVDALVVAQSPRGLGRCWTCVAIVHRFRHIANGRCRRSSRPPIYRQVVVFEKLFEGEVEPTYLGEQIREHVQVVLTSVVEAATAV